MASVDLLETLKKASMAPKSYIPRSSPSNPHFLVILEESHINNCFIEIPRRYMQKYGYDFEDSINIHCVDENIFQVSLERQNNCNRLTNGVEELINSYGLAVGNTLLFKKIDNKNLELALLQSPSVKIEDPFVVTYDRPDGKDGEVHIWKNPVPCEKCGQMPEGWVSFG